MTWIATPLTAETPGRGLLILFEGLDRSGKSTQADLTASFMRQTWKREVELIKFPGIDRQ